MKISKEIKIDLYNRMVRQRTFEDETTVNFASGAISQKRILRIKLDHREIRLSMKL